MNTSPNNMLQLVQMSSASLNHWCEQWRITMLPFPFILTASLFVLLCGLPSVPAARPSPKPYKNLVLYFHGILYDGTNAGNATSAIVGAPAWGNLTILAGQSHFGDVVVFDDPITMDNNLHSPPVGRAQGLYLYDQKQTFCAWLAFTFLLDSNEHRGTITFAGADPLMNKTRQISVIGGTGDFFMTRGVAALVTDAMEGNVYFRLKADINLYECYDG